MRSSTEDGNLVGVSYSKDKLIEWYRNEMAEEDWEDIGEPSFDCHGDQHTWRKVFKKGSILEWFNPINIFDKDSLEGIGYGHGIQEEWVFQENFENFIKSNGDKFYTFVREY